ncbi:MAG: ABC transporter ATP-binding protein [Dethiosulfovibrio peptidovorans]|nr:MAG: ABC transporter ATP-binding protein [Dethiosulfovibrio peptidovorans]
MFLKVEGLEACYGKVKVLHGISMAVEKGSIVALIGANGAGKSTFMMCMSGVVRPTAGKIILEGQSIEKLSPDKIVALGLSQCPEGRRVWAGMSVLENLETGAISIKNKKKVRERLEWAFEYFPVLEERKNQVAGSLSGGEQQMLAIARAVMPEPKLLMLDEPSLGLAPIIVEKVMSVIKNISQNGTTVILVEQNAFMALSIADYAYVLENGSIALSGKASELLENDTVRKSYLGV